MGKTALHDAVAKGNVDMVAYMMEHVNPNVDAREVVSGISIHVSCCIVCEDWGEVRDGSQMWMTFR